MTKILSYNVEAQRYNRKEDIIANGMKYYEWNDRIKMILDIIQESDADIICLQEVEIATFEEDYKQLTTTKYNWFGHLSPNKVAGTTSSEVTSSKETPPKVTTTKKKKLRASPIGNFILWKNAKFKSLESTITSCSVIVKFENLETHCTFKMSNVHLKAGISNPESIKTRISQLKSIQSHNPDIICGDFNDNFEKNQEIINLVKDFGYVVHNKYLTCFTLGTDHGANYWCFDNFLTMSDKFNVNIPKCKSIQGLKIPDDSNPSDHIPLTIFIEQKN